MKTQPYGSPTKRIGDRAELRLIDVALSLGFDVLHPWGDNSAYDVVLLTPTAVRRVQVRSTATLALNRYRVQAVFGNHKRVYSRHMVDFLAAYVFPHDAWYIFPMHSLKRSANIYMRPHLPVSASTERVSNLKNNDRPAWERYRNAWHLLE